MQRSFLNRLERRYLFPVITSTVVIASAVAGSAPAWASPAPAADSQATTFEDVQQTTAVIGAALAITSDGTPPWEDRPLEVPGMGTIPGRPGVADPGDDIGSQDRVVR